MSVPQGEARKFHTLDAMRGIAAISVVPRHVGPLGIELPESFLAVDLFFLLSGFVIANAYDGRLGAGGFLRQFLLLRAVRLYPLYLVGLSLGLVQAWIYDIPIYKAALVSAILMLPATPLWAGCSLYNGPTWTLPLELAANGVYAAAVRAFRIPLLCAVVAASALGLVASYAIWGTLDAGWDWQQLPLALSRLSFSFFAGVLLFRLIGDRRRVSPAGWGIVMLATALLLTASPPPQWRPAFELAAICILFPLLVAKAATVEPSPGWQPLCVFLGVTSYALYTVHQPLGGIVVAALHAAEIPFPERNAISFIIFCTVALLIAAMLHRWVDVPARGALRRLLLRAR